MCLNKCQRKRKAKNLERYFYLYQQYTAVFCYINNGEILRENSLRHRRSFQFKISFPKTLFCRRISSRSQEVARDRIGTFSSKFRAENLAQDFLNLWIYMFENKKNKTIGPDEENYLIPKKLLFHLVSNSCRSKVVSNSRGKKCYTRKVHCELCWLKNK